MDDLEKYIRKNRNELDQYTPPEEIWKGIENEMESGKKSISVWISSAAMIIIILGLTILLYKLDHRSLTWKNNNHDNSALMKINPQIRETEIYYNNLINDLYNEAIPMLTSDPDLTKELNYDLSKLDTICLEIKKDLKDNVSNQEVIEALINNYRIKIRLLNDMLDLLKQNKNEIEKTNNHAL
jgi:hypothetical protein